MVMITAIAAPTGPANSPSIVKANDTNAYCPQLDKADLPQIFGLDTYT